MFCTEIPEISGPVNATAPNLCTMNDFTSTLAQAMWRPHRLRTPEWLIRYFLAKERADILLGSVKVYPKKALDHGFEFVYPDYNATMAGLIDLKF